MSQTIARATVEREDEFVDLLVQVAAEDRAAVLRVLLKLAAQAILVAG